MSSFPFNLTCIFIGTLLLGVGTHAEGINSYAVIVLVAVVSIGSVQLLYKNTEKTSRRIALIGFLLGLLNLSVAYYCLKNWAAPNNIIILGAWILFSSYIFYLAANTSSNSVHRLWLLVNVVFTACLILAPSNINGVTLYLKALPVPTKFSVYPDRDQPLRATQHSRHYEHYHGSKQPEVALHSPVASNKDRHFRIVVSPIRTSSVELRGITMDSYVGYRKITLAKIWSEALWGIPTSFPEDNGSKSDEKDGTKMIIPRFAIIDLRVPVVGRSPEFSSKLKHIIRSIVLWELVFCAFYLLAPLNRRIS